MDPIEFHCRNCDTRLRVQPTDKDKLIRCPSCSDLQRYVGSEEFRPVDPVSIEPQSASPGHNQTTHQDWWSLRTADGQEFHQLDRPTFEHLVRQGHANTDAFFIGGEYRQWTPIQRLYQSATGPQHAYEVPTGSMPTGTNPAGPSSPGWGARYDQPNATRNRTVPTREQQLKDGWGNYVFVLGIVSVFTFCFPVVAIVGVTLGVVDAFRLGNGTISNRYQTRLVIGLLLSLFSLAVGTCYGCSIRIG